MSLIEIFKKQDKFTIEKTMLALMADSTVFSDSFRMPNPMLTGHELCAFLKGDEVVFLIREYLHDNTEVIADERPFKGGPPQYFHGELHWSSPVYLVRLLCHAYKEVMRKTGREEGKVHCVLLTCTKILNREEMEGIWERLGVTVVDDASWCPMTTGDGPAREKELLGFFLDNIDLATWTFDPQYDSVQESPTPSEQGEEDLEESNDSFPKKKARLDDVKELFTWTPFEESDMVNPDVDDKDGNEGNEC